MQTTDRSPSIGRELGAQLPRGIARREQIVRALRELTDQHGYPPTQKELSGATGIPGTPLQLHLEVLRAHGRLTWQPGRARTLQLLDEDHEAAS